MTSSVPALSITEIPKTDNVTSTQFSTKDLNQAAWIWCYTGVELVRLTPQGGRRNVSVHFIFVVPVDQLDLAAMLLEYANGKSRVDPLLFCHKQTTLRDLLHTMLDKVRGNQKERE